VSRIAAATFLCGALAVASVGARQAPTRAEGARPVPTRAEGDSMERKLAIITERGTLPPERLAPAVKTSFTDRELNAYLTFNGQSRLPVGLREPRVTVPAANRFDGRALVDLDEVRNSKDYGFLGLLLQGVHELKLSGTFSGTNGKGVVHISAASLDGVSVPQSLVDTLVSHFSKSPDMPGGFALDRPFDLPSRIRMLQLQNGLITVIQ
jgi:hypothetical protein